jgi:hypothetical protein
MSSRADPGINLSFPEQGFWNEFQSNLQSLIRSDYLTRHTGGRPEKLGSHRPGERPEKFAIEAATTTGAGSTTSPSVRQGD